MKRLYLAVFLILAVAFAVHTASAQIRPGDLAAAGNLYLGGAVAGLNGFLGVANGVPVEVYNTAPAAGTASIAATTMLTPSVAGAFRVAFYATQTAAGAGCTGNSTVALNLIWTDPNAAAAQTVVVSTATVTTNGTVGQVPLSAPILSLFRSSKNVIQFSTTYTAGAGCTPAPAVQVFPVLEAL
jgi:hypothetical protein